MKKTPVNHTIRLCLLALTAALCFVSNYLSIPIATIGSVATRIHFGNVFCLFAGFLLGPVSGGLAAGVGAFLYDLTNPLYIAGAPFTFVFKFALGFVCGLIAHAGKSGGRKTGRNLIGGIAGSLTYVVLYLSKSFITDVWVKSLEMETAWINLATKAMASTVNGIIAVVVSVPLVFALRKVLAVSHLDQKLSL